MIALNCYLALTSFQYRQADKTMQILQDFMPPVQHIDASIWEFAKYVMVLCAVIIGFFAKDAVNTLRSIQMDINTLKTQSEHTAKQIDTITRDVEVLKNTTLDHEKRITKVEDRITP